MSSEALRGGNFYGTIQRKREQCGAIFTDLSHSRARKLPAHSHELPFFAVLLQGSYGERYGRNERQFGPFTMMFRPGGVPHQDEIGPNGLRFFEIEIRQSWQEKLQDCSGNLGTAYNDCAGGELLWLGMKLFRETREWAGTDNLGIESALAELLGAVAHLPRETRKDPPRWMSRVMDKLRTEFCERLTLDGLSQEAGVHPVHLSRVFRKCAGEGIGDFLHRLRLRAACEQMLKPEASLAEIGLANGFADQSHFTRAFRKVTGTSPGAFRATITAKARESGRARKPVLQG